MPHKIASEETDCTRVCREVLDEVSLMPRSIHLANEASCVFCKRKNDIVTLLRRRRVDESHGGGVQRFSGGTALIA